MTLTPEQEARQHIDAALKVAGWLVQNRADVNLAAGPGVAVREFKMAMDTTTPTTACPTIARS